MKLLNGAFALSLQMVFPLDQRSQVASENDAFAVFVTLREFSSAGES